MATMIPTTNPSNLLRTILDRANTGNLPADAATFAAAALEQVIHLHLVIEEMDAVGTSTDGPEELLDEISAEARRWLNG